MIKLALSLVPSSSPPSCAVRAQAQAGYYGSSHGSGHSHVEARHHFDLFDIWGFGWSMAFCRSRWAVQSCVALQCRLWLLQPSCRLPRQLSRLNKVLKKLTFIRLLGTGSSSSALFSLFPAPGG